MHAYAAILQTSSYYIAMKINEYWWELGLVFSTVLMPLWIIVVTDLFLVLPFICGIHDILGCVQYISQSQPVYPVAI